MCYIITEDIEEIKSRRMRTNFVLKVENFPGRVEPVRSSVIRADVGRDEETSLWVLDLTPGDKDITLSASLWRKDHLPDSLDISLTLTIFSPSLIQQGRSVSSISQVNSLQDHDEEKEAISLDSFITKDDFQNVHKSHTLKIECQLDIRNLSKNTQPRLHDRNNNLHSVNIGLRDRNLSVPEFGQYTSKIQANTHSFNDLSDFLNNNDDIKYMEKKHIVFGPVEELHYLQRKPKVSLWEKITRNIADLVDGIQAGPNIQHSYLLIQAR